METAQEELQKYREEELTKEHVVNTAEEVRWALKRIDELKAAPSKPRSGHWVIWMGGSDGGRDRLKRACAEAEAEGMILVGIVPGLFGNAIAAFIGAESVVTQVKL